MFSRQSDAEEVFGFSLNRNSCLKNSFLKRQQLWKNLLFYKTKRSSEVFLLDLESVTEKKNFRKLCRIYKNQEGSGPGRSLSVTQSLCVQIKLLLGVRDLHGAGRRDPEALQRVFGHACLRVALKLHEGDVVFPRDEPDLFEPRKPAGDKNTVNTLVLVPVKTWT